MLPRRALPLLAVLLSVAATAEIATRVYSRLPRLEDELANVFQARVFASGKLFVPSPDPPAPFSVPFVIDFKGRRFSKYPPGESLSLALGVLMGDPWLTGPLLGALGLAVIYRLARELFGAPTAGWAVCLGLTSPFFLMLTPSLMPHAVGLLAAGLFALGFLRMIRDRVGTGRNSVPTAFPGDHKGRPYGILSGAALGVAFLIRPFTALCLAVPFAVLILIEARLHPRALRRYLPVFAGFAPFVMLLYAYNFALTGQPRLSLYELWWPFDRLGFGASVGPRGYGLADAVPKLARDLFALAYDLHGVPLLSLAPLLLGLLLPPRTRTDGFLGLVIAALIVSTFFYHHSSRLYGPRYIYEALPAMLVLGARGIMKAVGDWSPLLLKSSPTQVPSYSSRRKLYFRPMLIYSVLGLGIGFDLIFFLPFRLSLLRHLYDDALNWSVVETARRDDLHAALVFMFTDDWPEAAAGISANDPDLRADVIYARYLGPDSYDEVTAAYPTRAAYFWRDGNLTRASDPPPDWYPAYPELRPPSDE